MTGVPGHLWGIFTLDPNGSGLTAITNSQGQQDDPAWAPTGTHLTDAKVVIGRFQIFRIRADGAGVVNLSNNGSNEYGARWSPIFR